MERKGDSSKEFLSLARALESDTEWHRTVMHATYEVAINNRVAPSKPSIYDTTHLRDSDDESRRQTKFPCPHCKDLINNYNKHVMNTCVNFIERHNWRKSNIINYIDTTLDHNKFKIFCDLPDRRTSGGGTVPKELLPNSLPENDGPSTTELKPDLVVIDRESNQVHIFVISIVDESEMADTRKSILENYYYLVESLSEIYPDLRFQTVEIGTFTGQISEGTKFSLWEIYKLTTCTLPVNVFIDNIVLLAKIGSFVVFKLRKEKRWSRNSKYLHPATVAVKQPGFVRRYLIPAGKVIGIVAGVIAIILILHFGYVMSGWIWEHLTVKVIIFLYATAMILFLALYRP